MGLSDQPYFEPSYAAIRHSAGRRRGDSDEVALLRATVRKLHAERKVLHTMLTEAGIPSDVMHDGVRTCLIGRVGVALERLL